MAGAPPPATGPTRAGDRKRSGLIPIIVVVAALIAAFVIFNLTRSGPNYQEEQVPGPDPVETTT